jgi:acetyltransferase
VEVFKDRALALPPLNTTLARRMMESTKIFTALKGVRGRKPVDIPKLEDLLVRFSQLVVEQAWIKELDINPLLASPENLVALDARVVIHDPKTKESELPKSAIRPYPIQYVGEWMMKNGEKVALRPIRPEDEPTISKFHEKLSERTVLMRYFTPLQLSQRTAHERLTRICFVDYDREMAMVAERRNAQGVPEILAVSRLHHLHGTEDVEASVVVIDEAQHLGLGSELMKRAVDIARKEGAKRVVATMLQENEDMQAIFKGLGFHLEKVDGKELVKAYLEL